MPKLEDIDKISSIVRSTSIWALHEQLDRPLIVAHRGYAKDQDYRSNTLPAFKSAFELGADVLECDLRLTRDDEVVIHHGPFFFNGFGIHRIRGLPYLEIVEKLGGKELIPRLEDLYQLSKGHVPLFLQIKDPNTTTFILDYIIQQDYNTEQIYIMGYLEDVIKNEEYRDFNFGKHYLFPFRSNLELVVDRALTSLNVPIISPHYLPLTQSHLQKINAYGFLNFPFTINKPDTIAKYLNKSITGVYTDNLEIALEMVN